MKGEDTGNSGTQSDYRDGLHPAALKGVYDHLYEKYIGRESKCPVSVGTVERARKRVVQVLRAFGLLPTVAGLRVLDLGCGYGFTAEAFRQLGASVVGIDLSPIAIARAKVMWPGIDFQCGAFPAGLTSKESFDLIWAVDLPAVGVTEEEFFKQELLMPSLKELAEDGNLVIGWHTDLSGAHKNGWNHFSMDWIRTFRKTFRVTGTVVPPLRHLWLSMPGLQICRSLGRSAPVYFRIQAKEWHTELIGARTRQA